MMSNKPRLLIADDSENIRREMLEILEDEYDLVQATDGEEAWTLINADKTIKMVFTDLCMPEVDGLTLLKRIRNTTNETLRSLPVIMMTNAEDDLKSVKESLASGVTDLVRKPFIPELLRARAQANVRSRMDKHYVNTATVDPLTQLANEPYFLLRGANNLSYAVRHKAGFGVLLIEIDNFNLLSERYEPYVIESVQVKVGSYVSLSVRSEDTVARLEAGSYGVLLQGLDPKGVLETATRICEKIKKKIIRYNDERFKITVSIGASSPELKSYTSFEMIMRQARSELVKAIKLGGGHVESGGIHQRLSDSEAADFYVPSLDEALDMLTKNQGKLLDHCVEELFNNLSPLLSYCGNRMKLEFSDAIRARIDSAVSKRTE